MISGKYTLCGLKEYQKNIFKGQRFMLITTLTIYKSCNPQENKTYIDWKNITKTFLQIADLDINNHSEYT